MNGLLLENWLATLNFADLFKVQNGFSRIRLHLQIICIVCLAIQGVIKNSNFWHFLAQNVQVCKSILVAPGIESQLRHFVCASKSSQNERFFPNSIVLPLLQKWVHGCWSSNIYCMENKVFSTVFPFIEHPLIAINIPTCDDTNLTFVTHFDWQKNKVTQITRKLGTFWAPKFKHSTSTILNKKIVDLNFGA